MIKKVIVPTDHLFDWLGVDLNYLRNKVDLLVKEEGELQDMRVEKSIIKKVKNLNQLLKDWETCQIKIFPS